MVNHLADRSELQVLLRNELRRAKQAELRAATQRGLCAGCVLGVLMALLLFMTLLAVPALGQDRYVSRAQALQQGTGEAGGAPGLGPQLIALQAALLDFGQQLHD